MINAVFSSSHERIKLGHTVISRLFCLSIKRIFELE
jgi:hypothetical protein